MFKINKRWLFKKKPKDSWKSNVNTDKYQVITILIVVDNYNNIFILQLK